MAEITSDWGLAYTAAGDLSVAALDRAITSYLASRTDTMALLEALLTDDPDMVMAVCFRGYLLRLAAHPQFHPALDACIERAQALVTAGAANPRERKHVEALALWRLDQTSAALDCLEEILAAHPLDMLALRIAHYMHFYNGVGEVMKDSTARVLPAWSEEHPHYFYLQGMHAFGLEESGDYASALAHGQAAVAHNPSDIWATHAVSHVFQMLDRHEDGLDWLEGLKHHWSGLNNFRHHVVWHGALHHIGLGQPEAALAVYDESLAAAVNDDFYLDVCNSAALLWRLQFLGLDVGDRWQAMTDLCVKHIPDHELLFASLHYLIPLAVTGSDQTDGLLTTIKSWAQRDTDQGAVCRAVGVPLAEAIVQSPQAPQSAALTLKSHLGDLYRIGGSKAQRDLFRLLLQDNAQRANRPELAVI